MKALVILAVLAAAGTASAYPQFQLSKDQTCTACHLSPSGGGLLSENGYAVADAMSMWGTNPEFMYGKLSLPDWLVLGGDARTQQGYIKTPQNALIAFPMQADVYAAAMYKGLSLHVTGGYRPPEYGNEGKTRIWSREHYVMWQSEAGGTEGIYIRLGRLMPVFGLRFAEHPLYTRQYGGTPLYGETYAAAVSYITPKYEAHLTGFIKDPLIDPVVHDNGVAGYAELRVNDHAQVGAEGMFTSSTDDKKLRGGLTGKYYISQADFLVSTELQFVNQRVAQGGAPNQVVANLVGDYFRGSFMFEAALGYYNENIRVKYLDRDGLDVNVHWFTTSHLEFVLNTRVQLIGFGNGGPTGGWALLQAHYRL